GVLLAIVSMAAYPLAVTALEHRGTDAALAQTSRNGELVLTVALAGAVVLTVLAPYGIDLVVGTEYRETAMQIVPLVALAAALGGIKGFHFDIAFHLGRNSAGLV